MNTFLSFLAGFIALVLVVALAGPTFVDWNQFRGEFEAQAKKVTGRDVTIGGDISFVVLPAPHLTLNNVSVANVAGGENLDFLRVGLVDVEVALAPLLSGEIRATSVKIARPQLRLEVSDRGNNNWSDLISLDLLRESGYFAPASVSLAKVSFEEGTITFHDRGDDRHWKVEHLNGDVTATSLLGPMRAEMSLSVDGIPLVLRTNVGDFSGDRTFKIVTEIQTLNMPAKILFSGISTSFSADARIDGTASLELGSIKVVEGETPRAPLRIEAQIVSSGDTATMRDVMVAMAGTTLKGTAEVSWRNRPNFKMQLAGEALTLDPVLDRFAEWTKGDGVPLNGLVNMPLPSWIDGSASIKVDGLLSRDVLIKDAKLDLALKDGTLSVNRARGDIAGGTRVELSGALAQSPVPEFKGRLAASSDNISALALWLQSLRSEPVAAPASKDEAAAKDAKPNAVTLKLPPVKAELPKSAGVARAFAVAANVSLKSDVLAFNDIRAAYAKSADPAQLSGAVVLSTVADNPRVKIDADLKAQSFDADPIRALWAKDARPDAFLKAHDFVLKAEAGRLTIAGENIAGLIVDAQMTDGKLTLTRFDAASLAGATLSFTGNLDGVTEMKPDKLTGSVNGSISAEKAGKFFSMVGFSAAGLDGPADIGVAFSSGHADDSEDAVDTLTLKGTLSESRVDAVLKRLIGKGGDSGAINLIANANNADARVLLSQLGFQSGEKLTGAGSVSLQMSGPLGKPYDVSMRVNVNEATLTTKGTLNEPFGARDFVGQIEASASGVDTVIAALGIPDYLGDFVRAQTAGPGFVGSSKVTLNADALSFNGFEVVAGNLHLAGDTIFADARDGQLPMLTGKIESNLLDLTPLFGKGAKDGSSWSAAALDMSDMSRFGGNLDLKIARLQIGTLRLDEANMHVALADDVLSVTPMTARMADGAASFTVRVEGGKSGEPGIGLTYKVDNADFAKLSAQIAGAGFAAGRVSAEMQAEAQGRSWLGLVSSINGVGKITTKDARLAPLNVAGYSKALEGATSVEQLAALTDDVLAKGETKVSGLDGDISMKDGLGHFTRSELKLDGGQGNLTAMLDVPRLSVDSEMRIGLSSPADAPGFSNVASGKIGAITRRIDTAALQQSASRRIIAKSIEDAGLKDIPDVLSDLIGGGETKGPSLAGIPVPLQRPQGHSAVQ
ncbi:MAG: AsmA family protein [Parvibaculum sp.]|nr:AsmA family protein [Parvibaculum sp.]